MKPIKALLLAAGYGTRLKPITNKIPKCLVEVNKKPMLEHWFLKLEDLGIKEILINTHYLNEKVKNFLNQRPPSKLKVTNIYEPNLRGTARTLIDNYKFFKNSTILFIHADNFTKSDLKGLVNEFLNRPKNCLLTMLTFRTQEPSKCGVVNLDENGIVKEFFEKVESPPSNIANGAVYLFDFTLIDWINKNSNNPKDFSCDILPLLMNKINTWKVDKEYIDIGTPQALIKANSIV